MIYVVSGVLRSGTALLMQCLQAGGMDLVYEPDGEIVGNREGYHPNPNGYFEQASVFEPEKYHGKAVKSVCPNVRRLPDGHEYEVAFMLRDPREVAASWESAYGRSVAADMISDSMWRDSTYISEKSNITVTYVAHRTLIEDPVRALQTISHWPIDARMAATAVDTSLWRHRRYSSALAREEGQRQAALESHRQEWENRGFLNVESEGSGIGEGTVRELTGSEA